MYFLTVVYGYRDKQVYVFLTVSLSECFPNLAANISTVKNNHDIVCVCVCVAVNNLNTSFSNE